MTAPTSPTGRRPSLCGCPSAGPAKSACTSSTGDPRTSNQESLVIAPQTVDIPVAAISGGVLKIDAPSGGGIHGLPPGSIFVYVFERTR